MKKKISALFLSLAMMTAMAMPFVSAAEVRVNTIVAEVFKADKDGDLTGEELTKWKANMDAVELVDGKTDDGVITVKANPAEMEAYSAAQPGQKLYALVMKLADGVNNSTVATPDVTADNGQQYFFEDVDKTRGYAYLKSATEETKNSYIILWLDANSARTKIVLQKGEDTTSLTVNVEKPQTLVTEIAKADKYDRIDALPEAEKNGIHNNLDAISAVEFNKEIGAVTVKANVSKMKAYMTEGSLVDQKLYPLVIKVADNDKEKLVTAPGTQYGIEDIDRTDAHLFLKTAEAGKAIVLWLDATMPTTRIILKDTAAKVSESLTVLVKDVKDVAPAEGKVADAVKDNEAAKEIVDAVKTITPVEGTSADALTNAIKEEKKDDVASVTLSYEVKEVKAADNKVTEFTVDVTPVALDAEGNVVADALNTITGEVTFKIPVPAGFAKTYAKVLHNSKEIDTFPVETEGDMKFVTVTTTGFSPFTVLAVDAPAGGSTGSTANTGNTGNAGNAGNTTGTASTEKVNNEKTGVDSMIAWGLALFIIAGGAVCALTVSTKKRTNK